MAQQTLQTVITLSGRIDNSFGQIGEVLTSLGTQINNLSRDIINFGKESVETYASYDDTMREAQAVGGYTTEEMEKLDALNREIAQTSTYTNLQSADAMVLIAQAGLDVNDIYSLLPSVLDLAMAGNLDLADSVDYLLSSLTSMGKGMEYAETLTDQMAKTASIGMTDIDTLGESMMRLGSASGTFFSSSEEILAILSAMSQFGHDQRGAQAGTWLRNFMLSLAAPTSNVDDMVGAMEELGIAQEEIEEYAASHSNGVAAMAVQSLVDQGLRIYDDQGKLLPAIDIIKSLRDTVRGSAEYSEDLTELTGALNDAGGDIDTFLSNTEGVSDNALYNIFSRIFGKRGITTALNLISISDEEWDEIMSEIMNSDGFAESMADTMQGGIGGAMRELEAAATEFKTTVGESLAPTVEWAADSLSSIVTGLSNMDEGALDALVSGLTVIAAAGPGLLIAGGAFRLIGTVLATGTVGKIGLLAVGIAAAAAAWAELDQAAYENHFGDVGVNMDELAGYVGNLGEEFDNATTDIKAYNSAVNTALGDYTEAGGALKEGLVSRLVTNATLTEDDIASLNALGDQMRQALIEGIDGSYSSAYETIELLGGIDAVEASTDENSIWHSVIDTLNYGYETAISQAQELGQNLRDAMTEAFADRSLTNEEIDNINSIMQQMNELMAIQTEAQNAAAMNQVLRQATTLGLAGVQEASELITTQRDAELAQLDDYYTQSEALLREAGALKIRDGVMVTNPDGTTRPYTQEDLEREVQVLYEGDPDNPDDGYAGASSAIRARYDSSTLALFEALWNDSELAGGYEALRSVADEYIRTGVLNRDAIQDFYNVSAGDQRYIEDTLLTMIDALGGYDAMREQADYYAQKGDLDTANSYQRLLTMYDFLVNGFEAYTSAVAEQYYGAQETYSVEQARADIQEVDSRRGSTDVTTEMAFNAIGNAVQAIQDWDSVVQSYFRSDLADQEYNQNVRAITQRLGEIYDLNRVIADTGLNYAPPEVQSYAAAWQLIYGGIDAEQYRIQVVPEVDTQAVEQQLGDTRMTVYADIQPAGEGDGLAELQDQGVQVSVDGDATELQATIDGEDGKNILTYVSGDATDLSMSIRDQDGKTLVENVTGNAASLERIINSYSGRWITVNIRGRQMFASGGRATVPSIFGEAGPEWAIPEEHSERTASLLDAARQASGFTWPELIARNGGLNAGGDNAPRQLVYSPTIIAGDASGVEQKLVEDKERLDRWYQEKQLRDDVEIYA